MKNNCMFYLPHELTGSTGICALFKDFCNGYGKDCIAFERHTDESRKALAEAIEIKRKEREGK